MEVSMKKRLFITLLFAAALFMCACGASESTPAPTPTPIIIYVTPAPTPEAVPETSPEPVPEPVEIGDTLTFGCYEQDNVNTNGKEKLEWVVLDKKDDKVFLISKYAIDNKQFNSDKWSSSPIRTWLNDEFYNDSFSDEEREKIVLTDVTADSNPVYLTDPGKDTRDYIFLLSINEAQAYFEGTEVGCEPTTYALAKGVYCKFDKCCDWWLRTPGSEPAFIAYVKHSSEISPYGSVSTHGGCGVRPAMWVSMG